MTFNEYLAGFANVDHLSGLNVLNQQGDVVHHIPAVAGKLGSLKLYNALFEQFAGQFDAQTATQGLIWFAEHVGDAQAHAGKHPNVDLLFKVQADKLNYQLQPVAI